jgi:8-oxo-dGTP diphosphatase
MQIYLIRHAHAGGRRNDGRDLYRPLSADGNRRAEQLVGLLAELAIDRLVSSPATRCVQTLEPLGRARNLPVDDQQALWEGSSAVEALTALAGLDGQIVVACSHGDIIPAVIEQLGALGVPVAGRGCELGSIWILDRDPQRELWLGARYVTPRASAII